jgi:PPOX class probable F420-dependent enzyme
VTDTQDGPELHPVTLELASGRNFAAISTLLAHGQIQTQYIWVGTDGRRLFVNTEPHRQKFKKLERDPRVTLAIRDEENPYRYAEVRGRVVETERGQQARHQIDELSRKYEGCPGSTRGGPIRRTRSRPSGSASGSCPSTRRSPAEPGGRAQRRELGGPGHCRQDDGSHQVSGVSTTRSARLRRTGT